MDFLVKKTKYLKAKGKEAIARIAATLFFEIISLHPFSNVNKRIAIGSTKHFLNLNDYKLKILPQGPIYLSLRIANEDIKFQKLVNTIKQNLVRK